MIFTLLCSAPHECWVGLAITKLVCDKWSFTTFSQAREEVGLPLPVVFTANSAIWPTIRRSHKLSWTTRRRRPTTDSTNDCPGHLSLSFLCPYSSSCCYYCGCGYINPRYESYYEYCTRFPTRDQMSRTMPSAQHHHQHGCSARKDNMRWMLIRSFVL